MVSYIRPLAYVSPYAWMFWAAFLLTYGPESVLMARSKPTPGEKTDRGSMGLIILASWLAFSAAFAVASWSRFVLLDHRIVWFALGILILLAGSFLRRYCFCTLGRYFTGNVKVQVGQPVIENGLYRLVRHPSYTGGVLMYLGTGLALTNWLSALILVGMGIVTYAYRVRVEEQVLATSLGQPYLEYMRRTKRFVPFVF
ncbi:MAG: isoprenylcysteine carboxylmethyltransferase family protein [Terriglobales bacterium]|jgi:protein-S-isoprenylcysteine O-methyltransferase Ste14